MKIYTSESVSVGHPDKLADQISDALLDAFLHGDDRYHEGDPDARVAVETLLSRGLAVVAGEVTTKGYVDIARVVRSTITAAGYTDTALGFDGNTCGVLVAIQGQSADIAQGVDEGEKGEIGAGDQGMMFGMATRETPELMPLPISIAHALTARAKAVRERLTAAGDLRLRPDVKSQVSIEYDESDRPVRVDTIVLSQQHSAEATQEEVRDLVQREIIDPVLANYGDYVKGAITYHINPTGRFEIGGPQGDTGVTGRKIIVDTYGGRCPHGGGAFSGKDPTKVDRSAAYAARYIAKNLVAAGLADRCVVQLAYAIGVAQPVAMDVETFGTATLAHEEIERRVRSAYDLSPAGIIKELGLKDPSLRYLETAKNGHFGDERFPWEDTSKSDRLRA